MGAYILRRLLAIVVLAFGVSVIHLIPGDPVIQMIGYGQSSAAEIRNLHHQLGLDLPLPVQYLRWLGNVLRGDFGYSYYSSTPVAKLVAQNIPYTIELAFAALIISLIVGIPIGIIAALFRGSFVDTGAMLVSLVSLSIPDFWLGILLITLFSVQFHFLPVFGGTSLTSFQSLILPALALGAGTGGITARFERASVIETVIAIGISHRRRPAGIARSNACISNEVSRKEAHRTRGAMWATYPSVRSPRSKEEVQWYSRF